MRIVLDTNVLYSALGWDGNEKAVLLRTQSEDVDLLLSEHIISEFIRVLSCNKFTNVSAEKISLFLEIIVETSVFVDTKTRISAIKNDPDDNCILECAYDGKADYIISGDKHLLDLKEYEGIEILNAKSFLKKMA